MMTSVSNLVADYNWQEAFGQAASNVESVDSAPKTTFSVDDIARIISAENGQNDEEEWVGVFELKDGRFVFVAAGCDYTGWD